MGLQSCRQSLLVAKKSCPKAAQSSRLLRGGSYRFERGWDWWGAVKRQKHCRRRWSLSLACIGVLQWARLAAVRLVREAVCKWVQVLLALAV